VDAWLVLATAEVDQPHTPTVLNTEMHRTPSAAVVAAEEEVESVTVLAMAVEVTLVVADTVMVLEEVVLIRSEILSTLQGAHSGTAETTEMAPDTLMAAAAAARFQP
jgi:hypothetical protein